MWLASALRKIEHYARGIRNEPAEAAPATAHLFIINPLTGEGMDNLFSTHPNTAEPHCGVGAAGSGARAWRIAPAATVELLSSRRIGTMGRRCVRQVARTVGLTHSQQARGGSAQRNRERKSAAAGSEARDLAHRLIAGVLIDQRPFEQVLADLTDRPKAAALEPRDRAFARDSRHNGSAPAG